MEKAGRERKRRRIKKKNKNKKQKQKQNTNHCELIFWQRTHLDEQHGKEYRLPSLLSCLPSFLKITKKTSFSFEGSTDRKKTKKKNPKVSKVVKIQKGTFVISIRRPPISLKRQNRHSTYFQIAPITVGGKDVAFLEVPGSNPIGAHLFGRQKYI